MSLSNDTNIATREQAHGITHAAVAEDYAATKSGGEKEDDALSVELAAREAAIKKPIGQAWHDLRTSVSHFLTNLRHHAIGGTPRAIVNNSSNILGAAHVATEVLMFKSSIPHKALVHNPTGPIDYVTRAIRRVFAESLSGSQSDIAEIKAATKGKPVKGFIDYIRDTEGATNRAIASKVGLMDEDGKQITRASMRLGNPWQTRSTLAGLVVWSLSTVIPDRRERPEEVERMAIKRETNPLGYIAERLKQAVWFPEWDSHKRQMIGLGIMTSGVCSLIGSWRNNVKVEGLGLKYAFNGGYFATSMLTLISSLPLLFATDDQKGFGGFGAWMTGRLAFLPGSIARKFKGDKVSAGYYTAAMASFQAENWTQALIGGAEKLPDGTIVDHEEVKRRAHEEAVVIRKERKKSHRPEALAAEPSPVVNSVSNAQLAMPERREAVLEAVSAANV